MSRFRLFNKECNNIMRNFLQPTFNILLQFKKKGNGSRNIQQVLQYKHFNKLTRHSAHIFILNNMFIFAFLGSEKIFRIENSNMNSYYRRSDANRQKLIHKAKMKSLRISVVIVAAFIICWTPYYIMMLIFMFLNPDKRVI
jgi:hypothetical protein